MNIRLGILLHVIKRFELTVDEQQQDSLLAIVPRPARIAVDLDDPDLFILGRTERKKFPRKG